MKNPDIIFYKNPSFDLCPQCKEFGTLKRSRARNFRETLVKKATFVKLYRCKKCGWRGYRSTLTLKSRSYKLIFLYLFLAIAAAFIVNMILTKFFK